MDNKVKSKSLADLPVTDTLAKAKIFVLVDGKVCWADVCDVEGGLKVYKEQIESLNSKISYLTNKLQESYTTIIALDKQVKELVSEKNEKDEEIVEKNSKSTKKSKKKD